VPAIWFAAATTREMTPDGSPLGVGAGASLAADCDAASARAAAA